MLFVIVIDYASLVFLGITLLVIGALAFVAFGLNQAILLVKQLSISLGLFTALVNLVHFFANLSDPNAFAGLNAICPSSVLWGGHSDAISADFSLFSTAVTPFKRFSKRIK